MYLKTTPEKTTSIWANLIVEELVRNGVEFFCISPGSRSTPLTAAVTRLNQLSSVICYDERSAAFHALGYARVSQKPAVLICTSGTAAANYFPAIIEAHQTATPMLILTADRPPELRQTGANQTIDQIKLYGSYVKWFFDLPVPDPAINPLSVLSTVDQAYLQSISGRQGPVHLNCMFRKPLEPVEFDPGKVYQGPLKKWWRQSAPLTQTMIPAINYSKNKISQLARTLSRIKSGILVVGRLSSPEEVNAVSRLAGKLNWPVFADIASGLRSSTRIKDLIVHYDQVLAIKSISLELKPDAVLHIGPALTSNRYMQFAEKYRPKIYLQICHDSARYDPVQVVTEKYFGDIATICNDLSDQFKSGKRSLLEYLHSADQKVAEKINQICLPESKLSEISVARIVSQNLPENHALFVGNSMPIRDFDMFADFTHLPAPVGSNRGASGIDGNLATGLGYARGYRQPVTMVVGDLTFIHDLNSLTLLREFDYPVVIIVINNHGGGIFSFLPITEHDQIFERSFATPHNLNFRALTEMFELNYCQSQTNDGFLKDYRSAVQSSKNTLIELNTGRQENRTLHHNILKELNSGS